jgi:elongation factor G
VKDYNTENIRNFCLSGQRGCGKTSLADAIAFNAGINNRIGKVDDGSSIMDYTEEELSRRTTISSKLLAGEWNKSKFNLLDSPGHTDFIGELQSCLKVTETVGVVINGNSGVEIGTQLHWKTIEKSNVSRFFFVNKMEVENVNWQNCLSSIQSSFGKQGVAVQIPIGQSESFKGIVDLLHMKAYEFDASGNRKEIGIPDDLKDEANSARENLVEVAAESDDNLLEKFFDEGTLNDDDFMLGFRKGILDGKVYPVLFGSADKNMGIKVLLDFIVEYMPAPNQVTPEVGYKTGTEDQVEFSYEPNGKSVGFVYKVVSEGHLGDMSFVKAFSGSIKPSVDLSNQQTRVTERVGQIYTFQGKNRIDMPSINYGDIGVLVKLKNTHTGNTLTTPNHSVSVSPIEFTPPVMDVAVKSAKKGDEEKIAMGFTKLHEEDPTFKFISDPALKQQVLYGQGPTHIDVLTKTLKTRFGVEVLLVKPKVPYRETIKGKAEKQYKHKKQSGGRGQYGDVYLRLEPNTRGGGFEFIDAIKGGVIPSKFIPAVEKGVVEAMINGGLAGSQVVDVKVTLYYGSYHDVDSSDMAFKIAGLMAFRGGFMDSKPVILEPILDVEITVPDDYTGDVMGDVSSRRGKISGMDPDGRNQIIRATIPQAELYQYSVDLRSMTQGQGIYSVSFSHYEEVPHDVSLKIIQETKKEQEEENS